MTDAVNNTLQRLVPIFQDVLDDDSLAIDATTTAQDVDGWDSLAHIRLVVSIEKAFSLRFSAAEISELQNVGDMAALIVKKQTGA
ncbi:MAG: acyl carrier protein [Alcaligenaceae bacterium]|jgi:acyl carrier protein